MYKLNLFLTAESMSELLKIKGQKIKKIVRDDFGESSILVGLDYGNGCTFIRNDVDAHPDYEDEYTQFVVSQNCDLNFAKIITYSIKKKVNGIQLITDYVTWKHGENVWEVEADIGILLMLDENEEILVEAVDSIAGFIRYYQGRDCLKQLRGIDEQWQIKTDKLSEAKRQIRNL
jgi:hypothetical protein